MPNPADFCAADLLEGFDGPAAAVDPRGGLSAANAAFRALAPAEQARALMPHAADWRSRPLPSGARLVLADRRRAGAVRRADVLATLSHEIRTPLNGVLGMAGLLDGTRLDPTQRSYLAALRDCGDHLLGLVGSVLDWARLDAGKIALETGPVDLERLLQGVAELLSPQAHAKGLDIAWAVDGPVSTVIADDGRLRQILFNLAGNAVKMTETGGVRLIATTMCLPTPPGAPPRVHLQLAVLDSGPGLSPEAQLKIFEPFTQTEDGVRAGGAGLGLAIVRQLADALGGRVAVRSAPGEGAVFAFKMDAVALGEAPHAATHVALAGRTVAVVSRSEVVACAAALQLESLGASAVRLERLGDVAASTQPIDLVLYDAPVAGRLVAAPAIPTLVLIAPEKRARIPGLRAKSYAGYLIKPLRRISLEARALAALAPPASSSGAAPAMVSPEDERLAPGAHAVGLRVLLAEDNPVNAMLATILLKHEGCQVDRASTGDEAVTMAGRTPYDLILLDLRMPGMDGLSAARAMRQAGVSTYIAALTANAFAEDRRACLNAGMDGFLTKPLDRGALVELLSRCRPALAA